MGELLPPETNKWLDYLFYLFLFVVLFYLCYRKRKEIVEALEQLWDKMRLNIQRAYKFLFGRKKHSLANNEYYEDTIEDMSQIAIKALHQTKALNKRSWIRKVKKYLKQSDKKEQYREGYKLLLQGIELSGIIIEKAYTPREIMKEVHQKIEKLSIQQETGYYEEIRYGDKIEQIEEVDELKQLLKALINNNL